MKDLDSLVDILCDVLNQLSKVIYAQHMISRFHRLELEEDDGSKLTAAQKDTLSQDLVHVQRAAILRHIDMNFSKALRQALLKCQPQDSDQRAHFYEELKQVKRALEVIGIFVRLAESSDVTDTVRLDLVSRFIGRWKARMLADLRQVLECAENFVKINATSGAGIGASSNQVMQGIWSQEAGELGLIKDSLLEPFVIKQDDIYNSVVSLGVPQH